MKISFLTALFALTALALGRRPAGRETVTHKIAMTMQIGGYRYLDPIVIGLFGYTVPKTVDNFLKICTRKSLVVNSQQLSYDLTKIHRIIPGFMMQGGDFTNNDGTGGMSIFGSRFEDENFLVDFEPGVVAMANSGPDSNGSQFFITFDDTEWLAGKHVVFGRVLSGQKLISYIETKGTDNGTPSERVMILECKELVDNEEEAKKCSKEL